MGAYYSKAGDSEMNCGTLLESRVRNCLFNKEKKEQ
jgi:hypothetical protein